MVVLGHIVWLVGATTGLELVSRPYQYVSYISNVWFAPYYMAAFFFLSGYASSFKRDLPQQIYVDFKRLVIPAIMVPILMSIVLPPYNDVDWKLFDSVITGRLPWFLMALFLSRLIFKSCLLYVKNYTYLLILLGVLSILGCFLLRHIPQHNYMSVFHGFAFSLFLAIGFIYSKSPQESLWYYFFALLIYVVFALYYQYDCPKLCAGIYFSVKQWPIYIIVAITGTYVVFHTSKFLKSCAILEFVGRHSLVIYLVHCNFIRWISSILSNVIKENIDSQSFAVFIVFFMFVGGTAWGIMWSCILNHKYFKWLLGK